jgi:hypothetical protein
VGGLVVILRRRRRTCFCGCTPNASHPTAVTLSPDTHSGGSIPRKLLTPLLWLAVLLSAAVFTIRGPFRAHADYVNDFAAPYTSARLWLRHQDPYNPESFWPAWRSAGATSNNIRANPASTHSIYPPPSVVVVSPFALLPWFTAWRTLILLSTILYLTALILLSRLIPSPAYRKPWTTPCQLIFIALGLLLAPAQSALHVSNVTALSASLLFIALYLLLNPTFRLSARPRGAPVPKLPTQYGKIITIASLFTLSLCLKPTLTPIVLLYLLYKRRWKTLTTTVTLTALITATFQLLQPNWNWLPSLRANIDLLFTTGAANNSVLPQNLTRSDRIDFQLPAYALTHSLNAAVILAALLTLALLVLWLMAIKKNRPPTAADYARIPLDPALPHPSTLPGRDLDRELLTLATLLTIGLLPFYQRFYSATLLLIPILWTLRNITRARARWILALCCVFLANTSVLPRRLGLHTPPTGPLHLLTEIFLIPHLNWLLLTIALLLINANRHPSESPAHPQRREQNP